MKTLPITLYISGFLLLSAGVYVLICFAANALADFFNVNEPVPNAEVLIVEGWVSGRFAESIKEEFFKGGYRYILISGLAQDMSMEKGVKEIPPGNSSRAANLAFRLLKSGIDSSKVKIVEAPHSIEIHKTFSMAKAAARWLHSSDPSITRVNIFTTCNHGRKTWCAYRRVFGKRLFVGILTFPQRSIPVRNWWTARRGFRWQARAFANYVYAVAWPISLVPDR